jgi:ornithine carbamoyltransferase
MKRDFLRVFDLNQKEIATLLNHAIELKDGKDAGACPIIGRSVRMIFEQSSTRTRVSFETGIYQLGGQALYLTDKEIQIGRGETISDTAHVLSRYLNAVVIRTHEHERIEEFAANATVPVINALTDRHHPCQALADLMTVYEQKGTFSGIRMAYIGDGNNVANSLIEAASRMGMDLVIACPEGFEPDGDVLAESRSATKAEILVVRDPREAAGRADVVYTDVWVSMGDEEESALRRKKFQDYQVTEELMACAKDDAIFMHCLPAHRGEEVTAGVIDGPRSVVFDQAENRLHAQKALLEFLMTG